MSLFKKKDKRYNDYYDNYSNRVKENIVGGFLWALIFGSIYGVYKIIEYLFF